MDEPAVIIGQACAEVHGSGQFRNPLRTKVGFANQRARYGIESRQPERAGGSCEVRPSQVCSNW